MMPNRIRNWLDGPAIENVGEAGDDFVRMVAWARTRLATLEATIDPQNLSDDLKSKKLFPETDDLTDPLGKPPDHSAYR